MSEEEYAGRCNTCHKLSIELFSGQCDTCFLEEQYYSGGTILMYDPNPGADDIPCTKQHSHTKRCLQ